MPRMLEKSIRRELPQTFDRRHWYVTIEPWGLSFRAKRSRKGDYPITWDSIFNKAMLIAAERARKEKKEKRKNALGKV